jgi:hypothetical protein
LAHVFFDSRTGYLDLDHDHDHDHDHDPDPRPRTVFGEGSYSRGLNKKSRFHTALGSARETLACLETAVAFG